MNTKANKSAPQALRRPSKQRLISGRGLGAILLMILLPPLGIMFLWHQGVFRTRGRLVLTALGTIEMTLLLVLLTPRTTLTSQSPLPVTPVAVTPGPAEENLNALYNIEQIIYQQSLAKVVAAGGDETDLMTDAEKEARKEEEKEVVMNTIVYAVYNHARLYHAQMLCGTQTNGRELTVREAMLEALGPCPNCNPPVWTD